MATYDKNTDYQALINQATQEGNTSLAKQYEQQRNAKIADMDKSQTNTNNYKSTDLYQNPATKAEYYSPDGQKQFGYNINGKTFKDQSGTQRIDKGSYVQTGDNWWQMGDMGGKQVDIPDFARTLGNMGSYQNMLNDIPYPIGPNDNIKNYQGQINDVISVLQSFNPTKSMGRDESQARAYSQLNAVYNQNLDKQLDNYNRDAVSRGMFGQLPTEALKQNAISESEVNKAAAIGDLASNLFTQDFNMARQTDAELLNRQNALLGALGQGYGIEADLMNNQRNDFMNLSNLTAQETTQKYNNAINKLNTLGYADEDVSNILGVPVGTPSEQINLMNIQDKMQRELLEYQAGVDRATAAYKSSLGGKSGGGGSTPNPNPNITIPQRLDIWEQAVGMLTKEEPVVDETSGRVTGYRKVYPSYDDVNALYLQLIGSLGYDPYELYEDNSLLMALEDEMSTRTQKNLNSAKDRTEPLSYTNKAKLWTKSGK